MTYDVRGFVADGITYPARAGQDYRIPDDERVIWDGEETTWGSLSGNERMSCERNIDGVLEGSYPI